MTRGLSRSGFDLDLREGQQREESLARVLRLSTVEVKSDKQAHRTGNVFVEYRQPEPNGGWKSSGLAVTTAEHWAFEVNQDRWLIVKTSELKEVARKAIAERGYTMGGDHDRYQGVLIRIADIMGISVWHDQQWWPSENEYQLEVKKIASLI